MLITWSKLKSDERAQILTALSSVMEDNVRSDLKMKAPPAILLEKWSSALTTNPPKVASPSSSNVTDTAGNFSPSAASIRLLDQLGKKFADLGMTTERRKAIELMRFIKPASIEQDKEALKIWASQLTDLAEEHRTANDFLQAGELYTMLGEATVSPETKAESLYKGGLLLYRAGRKQDAVKALEKAKADTNNLFYSKLATERLNQLQTR